MLKLQELNSLGLPKRALRGLLCGRRKLEAFAALCCAMRLQTGEPSLLRSFGPQVGLYGVASEARIGADLLPLLLFADRSPTTLGRQPELSA